MIRNRRLAEDAAYLDLDLNKFRELLEADYASADLAIRLYKEGNPRTTEIADMVLKQRLRYSDIYPSILQKDVSGLGKVTVPAEVYKFSSINAALCERQHIPFFSLESRISRPLENRVMQTEDENLIVVERFSLLEPCRYRLADVLEGKVLTDAFRKLKSNGGIYLIDRGDGRGFTEDIAPKIPKVLSEKDSRIYGLSDGQMYLRFDMF